MLEANKQMAKSTKPETVVNLQSRKITVMLDVPRTLKVDMNALAEIENKYGSLSALLNMVGDGSMSAMRFFLWAALIHEDDSLTEHQVGAMVSMDNINAVTDSLNKALSGSMPEMDKPLKGAGGKAPDPT